MIDYQEFIKRKEIKAQIKGFDPVLPLNENLFDWQKEIVLWALRKGKACLFEDCGLGKTIQQLEWAKQVRKHTRKPVLVLTPLAVSYQTKEEADKFGYKKVRVVANESDVINGINITNYHKLHLFQNVDFGGVVLDESSILKNMAGKFRNEIIERFKNTPYKLACSATPSPNDYMEIGNHSEFMNVLSFSQMLSMFFINDMSDTKQWRLKKHAGERVFWQWVCSWAIMVNKPSDLGFPNKGFDLPELHYKEHIVKANPDKNTFFLKKAKTLSERREIRKQTIEERCEKARKIVSKTDEQFVIWCGLNKESELLNKIIPNSVEITGSNETENRLKKMKDFKEGRVQVLITKPSIAGFGINWQHCHNMLFVGLSDSYEEIYQAIRRIWRFGQKFLVNVGIIIEEREGNVLKNIKAKERKAENMKKQMIIHTRSIFQTEKNNIQCKEEKEMTVPVWLD